MLPQTIALIIVVLAFGCPPPPLLAEVSLLECMYKYQENLDCWYRACMIQFIAPQTPRTFILLSIIFGKWKWKEKVLLLQSCPTLCNSMDSSLPGSSMYGIHQARILEWIAVPFSRGSSWPMNQTRVFHTVGRFFTV